MSGRLGLGPVWGDTGGLLRRRPPQLSTQLAARISWQLGPGGSFRRCIVCKICGPLGTLLGGSAAGAECRVCGRDRSRKWHGLVLLAGDEGGTKDA